MAPIFVTDLVDQALTFNAGDANTITDYRYYYLPEIKTYNSESPSTVYLNITGLDNDFMIFDSSLNKFIFVGITINNVGRHLVGVELVSSLDSTLTR